MFPNWSDLITPFLYNNIEGCDHMKITVISVGKIKEKYLKEAIAEYTKRLSRYSKIELIEVKDEHAPDNLSIKNH